jgi:hypothetical protein
MSKQATRSLFEALYRLIPAMPENCTRVELILSMNAPPELRCDFIIKGSVSGEVEEDHKRYTLSEIES